MRITGAIVAELLGDLAARAKVGVNLLDLELRARRLIEQRGAVSCYWDHAHRPLRTHHRHHRRPTVRPARADDDATAA